MFIRAISLAHSWSNAERTNLLAHRFLELVAKKNGVVVVRTEQNCESNGQFFEKKTKQHERWLRVGVAFFALLT